MNFKMLFKQMWSMSWIMFKIALGFSLAVVCGPIGLIVFISYWGWRYYKNHRKSDKDGE